VNGGIQPEFVALIHKRGFFSARASNGQIGVRKLLSDGCQRLQQQIETLDGRKSTHREQMRAGASPLMGAFAGGIPDRMDIHGIWQDRKLSLRHSEFPGKIVCHCLRLANDPIRMAVEQPIEQTGRTRQVSEGQSSGGGSILPHQTARIGWKERTEQEHQKVQVRHAG
jgi:hypothetical protein